MRQRGSVSTTLLTVLAILIAAVSYAAGVVFLWFVLKALMCLLMVPLLLL